MVSYKFFAITKNLEDQNYPLLGPNLKGLRMFGLMLHKNLYLKYLFIFIHIISICFVITQVIELCYMRTDFDSVLVNLSITALSFVTISKTVSCLKFQSNLKNLIKTISQEEHTALKLKNKIVIKLMSNYTTYARVVTNLYWFLVLMTNIVTIVSPFLKYISSSSYNEGMKNITEPYPEILVSWFPFDNSKMPGYLFATVVHIVMITQGAGVIAVYDANAVAVMTFIKGQFIILREKCRRIFGDEDEILTTTEVLERIKECHRHHNFLLTQHKTFNLMMSPVMFIYMLVCSIGICCSIARLSQDDVMNYQKFTVFEFATAVSIQLFLYCWHSNEIAIESDRVVRGVCESNWWKASLLERKQLTLLAGKLTPPLIMKAGPFTQLSIPTFVDIMKGAYSFYALFTKIQEK